MLPSFVGQEIQKAKAIKDLVLARCGDDPELIHDMIEGETDFLKVLSWVYDKMRKELDAAEACKQRESEISKRRGASEKNVLRWREVMTAALSELGEKTIRLPEATLTLANIAPSLVVYDEGQIPEDFWKEKTTKSLDRKAVTDALKKGDDVPGAMLSNGGVALQVRV